MFHQSATLHQYRIMAAVRPNGGESEQLAMTPLIKYFAIEATTSGRVTASATTLPGQTPCGAYQSVSSPGGAESQP
jgi:hypothetical protein